jgi:hypothetical protein
VDALALIGELRQTLTGATSAPERERWWTLVRMIETSLSDDAGHSTTERKKLERVRSGIGDLFHAINTGKTPVLTLATVVGSFPLELPIYLPRVAPAFRQAAALDNQRLATLS